MSKKRRKPISTTPEPSLVIEKHANKFHFQCINRYQEDAWDSINKNEITFLLGPAGCGKTQVATAYASQAILSKKASKFLLCRPMVSTEQMGYLPGTADEKIHPYLIPILDSVAECTGKDGPDRKRIIDAMEFTPLAFLRGRTFNYSVAILDEAQNCTIEQLKLWLTRIGRRSKLIVTGDPHQSDLKNSGLMHIVDRLDDIEGVGIIRLPEAAQVRNPLITKILQKI